jgi:trehalose/maltose hydrolase-like predicted phosphorylase
MTSMDATAATRKRRRRLEPALDRRFEAVLVDWEGTVLGDEADTTDVRELIEQLCWLGLVLAVIAETDVGDLDRRLGARPRGPGALYLCANRGSQVSIADGDGLRVVLRRQATAEATAALDAAARATITELERRGLRVGSASDTPERRTIDLVPDFEPADEPGAGGSADSIEERLREASIAGLEEVVAIGKAAALATGLPEARVTTDGEHLEIGLTDKSDSVPWLFAELVLRGIGPGLVAIAGAEPAGVPAPAILLEGGQERLLEFLADQLERRRRRDVPDVDRDPAWTLAVRGVDARLERVHESMLTLADGRYGTRGAPLFAHPAAEPGVFAGGVYVGAGPEAQLARAPVWPSLDTPRPKSARLERILDLRTGTLRHSGLVDALVFSSLASPGIVALRAQADQRLLPQRQRRVLEHESITAALADERVDDRLERLGGLASTKQAATDLLAAAERTGFEGLLADHRARWASRWDEADVVVDGDPQLQSAIRLALFHLMGSVPDTGEAAVGARGLSGPGYRGHVFWDSDVFVLPFLAATHPAAARAMLEYRVRRLPQAREAARRVGRSGARFPWEGAADGFDATPSHMQLPTGEVMRVRTGEYEEHIVADVAWAAACYLDWTGDEAFAAGPARELFVETARYWASRIHVDDAGNAHIFGVIGPDEYHESVDDNAYTNVMARWNLRRGAEAVGDSSEREHWLRLADALVDGYDPISGVYEQFAGFSRLEPLVIADLAPRRPIAADLWLGRERTSAAQVVKQADVLMLHHLVPDDVEPGSLLPNLDFYEPRTAHGSSLSPAIHASLHARAGRFREAFAALQIAARIDLDDLTGTTASGVHLATMGGLWQALAFGFGGIGVRGDKLRVEPRLPAEWDALEVRLRFRGSPLRLRIARQDLELESRELALKRIGHAWEVGPR